MENAINTERPIIISKDPDHTTQHPSNTDLYMQNENIFKLAMEQKSAEMMNKLLSDKVNKLEKEVRELSNSYATQIQNGLNSIDKTVFKMSLFVGVSILAGAYYLKNG